MKQIDAPPRLRVEVREWKDYRDDSWRGLTPESEAGTSYDDYDFDMDGLSPISPPASSSEADSEEMDDERFGPDVQIPQSLTVGEFVIAFFFPEIQLADWGCRTSTNTEKIPKNS